MSSSIVVTAGRHGWCDICRVWPSRHREVVATAFGGALAVAVAEAVAAFDAEKTASAPLPGQITVDECLFDSVELPGGAAEAVCTVHGCGHGCCDV